MSRFVAGFAVASLLWAAAAFAYSQGYLDLGLEPVEVAPSPGPEDEVASEDSRSRRRRGKRRSGGRRGRRYRGDALVGDDLGGPGTRQLDVAQAGGEEQLEGHEIEQGFSRAMPGIRRCLVLVAADQPVTGRLVFGLRISGRGQVTRVNLKGPSAITKTEAGACLRKAARGIEFRSFNGPDMVVHYPLTLE